MKINKIARIDFFNKIRNNGNLSYLEKKFLENNYFSSLEKKFYFYIKLTQDPLLSIYFSF